MTDDAGSYRFTIGDFSCVALSDGSMNCPPGHVFSNVGKARIEADLQSAGLPVDYITTSFTRLLIETGAHQVLVDAGAGKLAPSTGRLVDSLRQAGVAPAQVDTVIITHAHPAHVGGMLDDGGEPVFAGARYFLWRSEWEFWTSEVAYQRASPRHVAIARGNLEQVREQTVLLEQEGDIVPGVSVIPAPGHTPGHTIVSVSSGGERLLYVGDTVFHPWHLEHPDWASIYDIVPEQAAAIKRRVFDLAAETGALVIAHHFAPFPSLGRISRSGQGWEWRPLEAQ